MRIAFLLPYGERRDGFFPDTLAGLLCKRARDLGHEGQVVRAYYEPGRHDEVAARIASWLDEREIELVVVERLFDPGPLVAHGATTLLVTRGEPFEPRRGIDFVIGANPTPTKRGFARSPGIGELVVAFEAFLEDRASASRVEDGRLLHGTPTSPASMPRPIHPVLEQEVIALGEAPLVRRKTIFGNAGCPFANDPLDVPHYSDVRLPLARVARLGCAFCSMGGDYQKRPDGQVVEQLIEQATWIAENAPDVDELVLSDQHSLRYLAPLMKAASGIRPMRWLFAARADAFVRERGRIEAAIEAAREDGHVLETYLSGFESFSERELARYNKGCSVKELVAAVQAMRELSAAHPGAFEHARAKGHSLILYSPWTTPEDLRESVDVMREHRLDELFDELGRNRLRLYTDLPITWAAERDGALIGDWQEGDGGAGEAKGYPTELPWRFLDPRTKRVRELAEALRTELGARTELAQLSAAIDGGSLDGLDALIDSLASRLGGAHRSATVVDLDGTSTPRGAIVITDEDHPRFVESLAAADEVCLVTDATRFASRVFAEDVAARGKLVAASARHATGLAFIEGWTQLRSIVRTLELRVTVVRETLPTLPRLADWARDNGADQLYVEAALDGIGLDHLEKAAAAVAALIERCDAVGMAIETAPLSAGTTRFDRFPTVVRERR